MMKWQQFRTGSEKHGVIYLGSLFVILNKVFRDHWVGKKIQRSFVESQNNPFSKVIGGRNAAARKRLT